MDGDEMAKMRAGRWYCCLAEELEALRIVARDAVHEHNTIRPAERGSVGPKLRALLGTFSANCFLEAPFHCAYGFNLHLAETVYLNAGCVIIDTAPVRIGSRALLGPGVQIYCADHHRDPVRRAEGIERARPVTIGEDVWIGGGAILLPGVTIGDGAIVGAGSVVTRNVAKGARVAGNPARPIATRRTADT